MSELEREIKEAMDNVQVDDFISQHGELTREEDELINKALDKLSDTLKKCGDKHISDLTNPTKLKFLRYEGGSGYTIRYLPKKWGKVPCLFSSEKSTPELQDRIFGLTGLTAALAVNQREIASEVDTLSEQVKKLDQRILAIA